MKRYYSQGKRFFRLSLDRWKEMRSRGKYMMYYIKPSGQGNALARNIDFYGLLFIVLLATFAGLTFYTGNSARGLLLSVPLVVLEVFFALKIKRMREKAESVHNRLWIAGRQCQERIKGIESSDGLNILVAEILEKLPGFTDVHAVQNRPEVTHSQSAGTSIRALYRGTPVAVGSMAEEGDNIISADKVLQFRQEIIKLDIPAGIMVAAGTFSGEARRAALEGKVSITLVDLYRLVDLARMTGHSIFPVSTGELKSNGNTVNGCKKLFRNALGREKARSYFMSAGLMAALYFTSLPLDFWGTGYLIFGMLNLALSVYCVVSNRERDLFPVG